MVMSGLAVTGSVTMPDSERLTISTCSACSSAESVAASLDAETAEGMEGLEHAEHPLDMPPMLATDATSLASIATGLDQKLLIPDADLEVAGFGWRPTWRDFRFVATVSPFWMATAGLANRVTGGPGGGLIDGE